MKCCGKNVTINNMDNFVTRNLSTLLILTILLSHTHKQSFILSMIVSLLSYILQANVSDLVMTFAVRGQTSAAKTILHILHATAMPTVFASGIVARIMNRAVSVSKVKIQNS